MIKLYIYEVYNCVGGYQAVTCIRCEARASCCVVVCVERGVVNAR